MKKQTNEIIGSVVVFTLKYVLIGMFFTTLSIFVFEQQKEEIWSEALESFQMIYETERDDLYNGLGITDKDDVDQSDWEYKITNIGFAEKPKQKEAPKIVAESAIICTKKILPEDQKDYAQSMIEDINLCIDRQIKDAIIIREVYMEETDKLPEGSSTKTILQSIIVGCDEENTIKDQGITDYSLSLQCIRNTMKDLNKKLEQTIMHNRMKKGEVL